MKWRKLYKEDTEEGAFKVGDRVRVADTYKGKPTTGGRFSYDPPSAGMTGTVVDINRQRYHDFKSGSMGLGMGREKTRMWYIVKIDDSCGKGCFVPGEYGFDERDLVKIDTVNEAYEDVNIKKLLKQNGVTKLPSGTEFKPDRVSWSKDGGYAGQKTLDKICSQLEDAGWKRGEWRTGGIPDGSAVTNSNAYTSPDGQLVMTYSEHFGATAHDNFYGFTFKLAGTGVNESDDWVGDDGGVEDDINPKFADLRDACDKIDDRGFQWSSGKWRIRPDELGYDWKIYYDGEGLIGAVNYKTREYDVWNTKVVNKHEIKDFLHALSADGFRPMSRMNESSRFGFNVGDEVELTSDVEPNRFSGRGAVPSGTVGEVVAVDKPMRGVIKVKIEDGTVVSVPERKLKMAGTDNEPWKTLAANRPPEPKRDVKPERPEDYYMRPTSYGSPRYTGD